MQDNALGRRLRELREASLAPEPEAAPEPEPAPPAQRQRRRLGELLVSKGLVTEKTLEDALAEQQQTGRPLGEILLSAGALTEQNLARTLTEQNGFDVSGSLRGRLATDEPGERYVLIEDGDPEPLLVTSSFLDAADAAFELIDERAPQQLAIVRDREGDLDCLWSYRRDDSAELIRHGAEDHPRFEEQ